MPPDLPPLLRHLSEELGYHIDRAEPVLGLALFTIDLSSWKLRLSNHTPVIWVQKADLEKTEPQPLAQTLRDALRERGLDRQICLVLIEGEWRPVRPYLSDPSLSLVLLGSAEQEQVLRSRRPSGELLDFISAQLPISSLAPYETRGPVTGSRFFGREQELARILGHPDTNYIILGIRRIGKTSLLRETERVFRERGEQASIVYLDCSDILTAEDYVREVVRKLNPRELPRLHLHPYAFYFPAFLERMARAQKRKLTFFLDEIDNPVVMQRGNWELFRILRASSDKGVCQYVMAGFREAMHEQYVVDSPFYNLAEEVRLSALTLRQAHDLIVTPMDNLRVRFKNREEVVGHIYEETAGLPNLIQYYCTILLRHLDRTGEREIGPENLIDVYADDGFRGHLLTSFMQNTENREKALVYAVVAGFEDRQPRGFSCDFVDAALRRRGVELAQSAIDEACDVLVLAGILQRRGREVFFTSPVFVKTLGRAYDLEYLFRKIKEEGL